MLGRRSALVSLILFSQHCLRAALAASPDDGDGDDVVAALVDAHEEASSGDGDDAVAALVDADAQASSSDSNDVDELDEADLADTALSAAGFEDSADVLNDDDDDDNRTTNRRRCNPCPPRRRGTPHKGADAAADNEAADTATEAEPAIAATGAQAKPQAAAPVKPAGTKAAAASATAAAAEASATASSPEEVAHALLEVAPAPAAAAGSVVTASGNIAIAGNSGINRHGQKDDNAQPRLVRREPSSSNTDVAAASEAAGFSGASVPAALLDIGSDRQAQGVNSEQGGEEMALQSTPGNVLGWVMEMGACKRKHNKDPIPIEDDRRLSQGGTQAKNVKKCADLCEASGACAAFSTSADTIGTNGPVDCKFFAGIHYGNLESGRLCYLNQKWAISAGYLPAPPPPPPSLVNPDGVPGLTGEPGEPGKDGKDLQKSSDNIKPKIIFVCLLNLVLTYWLFARLNKQTANVETAGASEKKTES